jgi:hypothetical protein
MRKQRKAKTMREGESVSEAVTSRTAATNESHAGGCSYQDIECWVRQLMAAGWLPVNARTLKESVGSETWRSPNGSLYRGPYRAWTIMKYHECVRSHSRTCTCGLDLYRA